MTAVSLFCKRLNSVRLSRKQLIGQEICAYLKGADGIKIHFLFKTVFLLVLI